jgi:hypothetical protein
LEKLNILVLHRLGSPRLAPDFLSRHVFSLKVYEPEHQYIYHDTQLPLPDYVRNLEFDAIILDVTLLCVRWQKKEIFNQIREDYSFIKNSSAVKIAFPQDEYDCSAILDEWMVDWGIDTVFSVISQNWNVLYPSYSKVGNILLGYTGYIDEALLNIPNAPLPERPIDIGYRARKLPPYFGHIGEEKWKIGDLALEYSKKYDLKADIALGEAASLHGKSWLDFIGRSKFTLGANSGSSLLDPYGDIQSNVREYLRLNPLANFKDVEKNCFEGLDGKYTFTAISPRVLEAGLLESGQILVEGLYSGVISPWEHFIPIKGDASNFADVVLAMRDTTFVNRMIKDCKEALLDFEGLRARNQAIRVIELIHELKAKKNIRTNLSQVANVISKYEADVIPRLRKIWRKQEYRNILSKFIHRHEALVTMKNIVRKSLRAVNVS